MKTYENVSIELIMFVNGDVITNSGEASGEKYATQATYGSNDEFRSITGFGFDD